MHICIVTLGACNNNSCVNEQCFEGTGPIHCNCSGTGFEGVKWQYGNNNIINIFKINICLKYFKDKLGYICKS